MLQTRKIYKNANNEYIGVFGQGEANLISGADALAQILTHQLLVVKGELKTDELYGVSWFSNENPDTYKILLDTQIKRTVTNNPYVRRIMSYNSKLDYNKNTMNVTIKVDTTEGLLEINI